VSREKKASDHYARGYLDATPIDELERAAILERVRANLNYAKANGTRSGKPIGRPRVMFRRNQVAELRRQGMSWRGIARELGAGLGTVRRIYQAPAGDSTEPCQNPIGQTL